MLYSVEKVAGPSAVLRLKCDPSDPRWSLPVWIIESRGDYPLRGGDYRSRVLKDMYSFCVFKRGSISYHDRTRGQLDLKPGDAVFVRPGFRHIYSGTSSNAMEDYVLFHGPMIEQLGACGVLDAICPFPRVSIKALEPIVRLSQDPGFNAQLKAGLELAQLLVECNEFSTQQGHPGLARVVEYIRRHPHVHHRNSDLAARCGLSERYFRSRFADLTGLTPAAYCEQIRMNKAAERLTGTSQTVAQIAADLGYEDALYFSRRFSLHFNVPPTTYRDQTL